MIVHGWPELKRAIDEAVPCDSPMPSGLRGEDARCLACEWCTRFSKVEAALMVVEADIERALDDAPEIAPTQTGAQ